MILFIFWITLAIIVGVVANARGRSGWAAVAAAWARAGALPDKFEEAGAGEGPARRTSARPWCWPDASPAAAAADAEARRRLRSVWPTSSGSWTRISSPSAPNPLNRTTEATPRPMKRSLFATGAALLMATTAANAASETLLVRGYWKAFVNMTDATTPICGMRTDLSNPAQTQSGSIIVKWFKGQPGLTIQVFKASWSFPEDGMKLPIYVIFDNGQPMLANGRGVNSQLTASGLPTAASLRSRLRLRSASAC